MTPRRPGTTTGEIHPGDEPNYWQHNSGQLYARPGFIPQNMYIPFRQQNLHSEERGSNGFADVESTLGLGFGSGPHAMRNGRTPHFAEARPPGGYQEQLQMHHNQTRQFLGRGSPGFLPSQMPVLPGAHPWSVPLSPWGHAYRGIGLQNVRSTSFVRPGTLESRMYPRHLPPVLPYLDLVHRGLVADRQTNYWDNYGQSFAMGLHASTTSSLNERKESTAEIVAPDLQKQLGNVRKSLGEIRFRGQSEKNSTALDELYRKRLYQVRRKSMDQIYQTKIKEVRRRSLGDVRQKSLDRCRRSADWDVGHRGEPEFRRGYA